MINYKMLVLDLDDTLLKSVEPFQNLQRSIYLEHKKMG